MPLKDWIERRIEDRRAKDIANQPHLTWGDDTDKLLYEDGYDTQWRLHKGIAHGKTLEGETAKIPADEFIERYLLRD